MLLKIGSVIPQNRGMEHCNSGLKRFSREVPGLHIQITFCVLDDGIMDKAEDYAKQFLGLSVKGY